MKFSFTTNLESEFFIKNPNLTKKLESEFFYKESKSNKKNLAGGRGGGGSVARVSDFFSKAIHV